MFRVIDAPTRGVQQVRPRMRNVGIVQVVAALVLGVALALGTVQGCGGDDAHMWSSAITMSALVGLAGLAMTLRLPRATAVAPALAAGSSLTLLGGAAAGWVWAASQPCASNVLDREVATLLLITASAAAALATALWLLISRDELEPWQATRGVVVATVAAVTVLVLAGGFAVLMRDTFETPVAVVGAIAVPWALAVAATGWLRPSPAIAMVTPAVLQALWLLAV